MALESFQRIYAGLVLENPPRGDARDKALVELVTDATDVAPVHDASDDCVQAVQWYFEQEREALSEDLGGPSSVMSRLLLWDTGKKVGLNDSVILVCVCIGRDVLLSTRTNMYLFKYTNMFSISARSPHTHTHTHTSVRFTL